MRSHPRERLSSRYPKKELRATSPSSPGSRKAVRHGQRCAILPHASSRSAPGEEMTPPRRDRSRHGATVLSVPR
ncbi:MAG: hypothetical protein ACXQTN_05095 [Methanoculleaceae archaeon]